MASKPHDFGQPKADFSLLEVRRRSELSLSDLLSQGSDLKGVTVVFWSSVCSHCRRYDSYLSTFVDAHPTVALVAVAARETENPTDLERAIADRQLRFPILHDADLKVADSWQVEQTPRAFLLDRQLRLLYRGAIDNFKYPQDPEYVAYLEDAIADLLADRPTGRPESPGFGCPTRSVYVDLTKPEGR